MIELIMHLVISIHLLSKEGYHLSQTTIYLQMPLILFIETLGVHIALQNMLATSFFITLVDDYTRFNWVYIMKQESDVHTIIPKFFSLTETQIYKVIIVFRFEKALNYISQSFSTQKVYSINFLCSMT